MPSSLNRRLVAWIGAQEVAVHDLEHAIAHAKCEPFPRADPRVRADERALVEAKSRLDLLRYYHQQLVPA